VKKTGFTVYPVEYEDVSYHSAGYGGDCGMNSMHYTFSLGMYWIQIIEIRPDLDIAGYLPAYAAGTTALLLCMLMCMKLCNLSINYSDLMSVI